MCPGPQHDKGNELLKSTVAAAAAAVNGKEEGVWEFFRSYTDEPHKSRYVGKEGERGQDGRR
jgi:hypothetical protein